MKLYELNRGDWFRVTDLNPKQPPDITESVIDKEYMLGNIDGMYSYVRDIEGNVYHFAVWTEVEKAFRSSPENGGTT